MTFLKMIIFYSKNKMANLNQKQLLLRLVEQASPNWIGDGYRFAKNLGHTTELFLLKSLLHLVNLLLRIKPKGLSLKDVELSV